MYFPREIFQMILDYNGIYHDFPELPIIQPRHLFNICSNIIYEQTGFYNKKAIQFSNKKLTYKEHRLHIYKQFYKCINTINILRTNKLALYKILNSVIIEIKRDQLVSKLSKINRTAILVA